MALLDVATWGVGGVVIALALLAFWIWMLVDLLKTKMKDVTKVIWVLLFIITYIAAIVWLFVRPKRGRRFSW